MSFITPKQIIAFLQKKGGATFSEICKGLYIKGKSKDITKKILKEMVRGKDIVLQKNKKYTLSTFTDDEFVVGRIEIHEKGFGFCVPENPLDDDVFISQKNLKNASHLDLVKVEILPDRIGPKKEGRVVQIIPETDQTWLGVVYPFHEKWFFCPWGKRDAFDLTREMVEKYQFVQDDIVLARLEKGRSPKHPNVVIVKKLGNISEPHIDTDILIHEYRLEQNFSETADKEAHEVSTKDEVETLRKDLTDMPFVTIDGEDAKDFDDAVWMDENNHLWVAIADVSFYVKANSKLDLEACERGNSFYFPDRVVPMLPEILSNHHCSLRPFEKKHAMVVEIRFDQNHTPILVQILPAIIESKARLTYTKVAQMLDGKMEMEPVYQDSLQRLSKMTQALYQHRISQGAVDFDMPEFRYFENDPKPQRVVRNQAHHLIEECMLAANQVVSKFIDQHDYPNVYRVHESPDPLKMKDTIEMLHQIFEQKNKWSVPQSQQEIQSILDDIKEHPFATQIQYLFLRTMAQARYDTEKLGHYGLGFEHYSHFTSPIRRYADLLIHRLIKKILLRHDLRKPIFPQSYNTLVNVCVHISKQDRKSLLIEREMKKIKGIRFIKTQMNKSFDAVVAGVIQRGLFAETLEFGIEGFVSEQHLRTKGYRFKSVDHAFTGKGKKLVFGQGIKVQPIEANLFKRQLNFNFIS